MHFIQPMHLQGYVSQHHQVACGETHRVPWGIPLGLLEGGEWVIVEGDHDLSPQIFRINHNCNCEVSGSYMLQLASAALSIPSSPSLQLPNQVPSPKSQVQEAGKLWMPWCRWSPLLVLHQQPGLHSYILLHRGTKLTVVLHRAADRSGSNRIVEADWL